MLLTGVLALFLAACGTPVEERELSDRAEGCPQTAIVSGAESVTLFGNTGSTDLSDMVLRGTFLEFAGECAYRDEAVTVDLALVVAAERGPALADGSPVELSYFVAVLNPEQEILNKVVFLADFNFEDRRTRVASREDLTQTILLPNARSGRLYSILIGFQLTEDQKRYNLGQ
ncbi:MAG: hypothetical protein AAGF58_03155 [Pseudomonadota bacterium]